MSQARVTADRYAMATLDRFVGHEIALSDWTLVDQRRIDAFAACTGDRQWIHVDAGRAARESPFGGTIAHGYLTLSLAASTAIEAGAIPHDAAAALNYGVDSVRFLAPVRAGARVRNRIVLLGVERKGGGRVLLRLQNTVEIDGEAKPALVAVSLALVLRGEDAA